MQLRDRRGQRGVAFAETMLMLSFIMLLSYAIVQTGLTSYYQVSADGAGFVGSHIATQDHPDGLNAGPTAEQAAMNVFQGLGKVTASVVDNPNDSTFETDLAVTNPGSGFGGSLESTLNSREIETKVQQSSEGLEAPDVQCLADQINTSTDTVATTPTQIEPGISMTALETQGNAVAGSVSGSLVITPATIAAATGTQQSELGAVAKAQAKLEADISQATSATNDVLNTPALTAAQALLQTVVNTQILGAKNSPTGTVVSAASVQGMLSGETGDIAAAAGGTLAPAALGTLQTAVNTPNGVLAQLQPLEAMLPASEQADVQALIVSLGNMAGTTPTGGVSPGDIANVSNTEAAVNATDAMFRQTAAGVCPQISSPLTMPTTSPTTAPTTSPAS